MPYRVTQEIIDRIPNVTRENITGENAASSVFYIFYNFLVSTPNTLSFSSVKNARFERDKKKKPNPKITASWSNRDRPPGIARIVKKINACDSNKKTKREKRYRDDMCMKTRVRCEKNMQKFTFYKVSERTA